MGGQQRLQLLQQAIQTNTGIHTLQQQKILLVETQHQEVILYFKNSQQGIGFSGLVTFTSGNVINDGSGNTLSFGENGTTTIDGGKITTGTVAAARITISGKNISDLNNNSGFTTFDASDVQNAVTNNVTSIDGAKITTGTILANRLKLSGSGGITIGSFTNDSGFTNKMQLMQLNRLQMVKQQQVPQQVPLTAQVKQQVL